MQRNWTHTIAGGDAKWDSLWKGPAVPQSHTELPQNLALAPLGMHIPKNWKHTSTQKMVVNVHSSMIHSSWKVLLHAPARRNLENTVRGGSQSQSHRGYDSIYVTVRQRQISRHSKIRGGLALDAADSMEWQVTGNRCVFLLEGTKMPKLSGDICTTLWLY